MKPLLKGLATVAAVCAVIVMLGLTFGITRLIVTASRAQINENHVAVLELEGIILDSSELLEDIEAIKANSQVKGVVMRINSPGGVVGPSQEYFQAIKELDQKIPVVVSMGAVAASGGYYAAMGARKIYANPGTLTASIGVIMEFVNTEKLYDWAKVKRFALKSGALKDVGSPFRPMKPEEKEFLQTLMDNIHVQFRNTVKAQRKIDGEALLKVTDGRIMTGEQAFEAKLVDTLGGLTDAIAETKKLAGLSPESPVSYPKPKEGFLQKYLVGEMAGLFAKFNETYQLHLAPGWNIMLLAPLMH